MNDIITPLRHYADFSGRCTRKPFWVFVSVTQVFMLLLVTPLLMAVTEIYTRLLVEHQEFLDIIRGIVASGMVDEEALAPLVDAIIQCNQEALTLLTQEHVGALALAGCAALLGLILAVPTLSITVRRLRDAGQSPWWVYLSLMMFIPMPGVAELGSMLSLVVFIMCWLPSVPTPPAVETQLPPKPEA